MREKVALIEHLSHKMFPELDSIFTESSSQNESSIISDQTLKTFQNLWVVWNLWLKLDAFIPIEKLFKTKLMSAQDELEVFLKNPVQSSLDHVASFYREYRKSYRPHLIPYKKQVNRRTQVKLCEAILHTSGVLYYSTKPEQALKVLNSHKIEGSVSQRYWEDGIRRKDSDPDFKNSFWLKGFPMNRSLDMALDSGSVILVFEREAIEHHHQIKPYVWTFSFSKNPAGAKREREDFVVLHQEKDKYRNIDNLLFKKEFDEILARNTDATGYDEGFAELVTEYQKKSEEISVELLRKPEGEFKFDDEHLVGILISGDYLDIYGPRNTFFQELCEHHKFLGVVEKQKTTRSKF